jgi:hypothetical protein
MKPPCETSPLTVIEPLLFRIASLLLLIDKAPTVIVVPVLKVTVLLLFIVSVPVTVKLPEMISISALLSVRFPFTVMFPLLTVSVSACKVKLPARVIDLPAFRLMAVNPAIVAGIDVML